MLAIISESAFCHPDSCFRYKPEAAATIAALPRKTSDGLPVEMGLDLDKDLKVRIHY